MDYRTHPRARGQALVECTVITLFVVAFVFGTVAVSEMIRKQMKHRFEAVEPSDNPPELLGLNGVTYDGAKLEELEAEGWTRDKTHRAEGGNLTTLHRDSKKMILFQHDQHRIGINL